VDRQYQLKDVLGLPDKEVQRIIEVQATQDVLPPGGAADGSGGAGGGQPDLSAMSDEELIALGEHMLSGAA
jgi:hypothetical protein